jgi:hypothetical protein
MRYSRDEYNNKMRRRILFALGASASSARRGWEILFPRRPFLDKVSRSPRQSSIILHPSTRVKTTDGRVCSIDRLHKETGGTNLRWRGAARAHG